MPCCINNAMLHYMARGFYSGCCTLLSSIPVAHSHYIKGSTWRQNLYSIAIAVASPLSQMTDLDISLTGYINASFMLLFFIVGVPWNVAVIGIILRRKLYAQPSLMLMLNLTITNLLVCLCIIPIAILFGIGGQYIFGDYFYQVCKTGILLVLLPSVSAHTIALLSLDRVIYLKKPLTYHLIVTPWRMFAAIVVVWIFSIAISLPPLFIARQTGFTTEVAACTLFLRSYWYIGLVLSQFVTANLIQFVGCGCICYITRKYFVKKLQTRRNRMSLDQNSPGNESEITNEYCRGQLQLVKIFGAIFTANTLTLIPVIVVSIAAPIRTFGIPSYIYLIVYVTFVSRSVIYPILEVCLTHEIRETISKFYSSCLSRGWRSHCTSNSVSGIGASGGAYQPPKMIASPHFPQTNRQQTSVPLDNETTSHFSHT